MDEATFTHSYQEPGGKSYLALIAKRTYCLREGAFLEPTSEQTPIQKEIDWIDSSNPGAENRLLNDTDIFCVLKVLTDVLVRGSAYSLKGAVTELTVRVEVGAAKKAIRVMGDRKVVVESGGRIAFTKPEPFEQMALIWDNAYGGRDRYAEDKLSETPSKLGHTRQGLAAFPDGLKNPKEAGWALSYPRNIAGRGFFLDMDRERADGAALPNLEDPEDRLTPERFWLPEPFAWMDQPIAACFEPIDPLTFPRAVFMLPPEYSIPKRPLYELSVGAILKEDLEDTRVFKVPANPRLYNCAPAGLAVCRLQGNERVKLQNLHPKYGMLEFELPGERPQLLLEPPGCATAELEARLGTVLIEPDKERVTLTWSGTLETAALFPAEVAQKLRHAAVFR